MKAKREITKEELKEILELHKLWVIGDPKGVRANLSGANLSGADLRNAYLRGANLSGATGMITPSEYLSKHFERCNKGYLAYKTFGDVFPSPSRWSIKPGEILTETVNPNRADKCGCGINVAPLDWVKRNYDGDIWQVLIRWEWLADVIVPYSTDGKIRCGKVELVKVVKEAQG